MKKLSLLLAFVMLVVLCAAGCGKKEAAVDNNDISVEKQAETEADVKTEDKKDDASAQETDEKQETEKEQPEVKEEKEEKETLKEEKPVPEAPEEKEAPSATAVDLNAVRDAIVSGAGVVEPLMVASSRLSSLYGIEASLVKQSACFVTITGVFPDEIVMIEAVDESAASTIEALLNNRLAEVKEQSKSYDPENYALAQQCSVNRKGCFVSMFLAPQHAKMKSIYDGLVK